MEASPDGGTLAYVVANEVWLSTIAERATQRRLAAGTQPRWSPDGTQLAFYSTASGTLQLWVADPRTGTVRQVTSVEGGINPDARLRFTGWIGDPLRYGWSPDGMKLVFTSQKDSHRSIESAPESGASQSTNSGSATVYTPIILTRTTPAAWTLSGLFRNEPQGPRFVNGRFTTGASEGPPERRPQLVNHLFVVDVSTGNVRQLTEDDGNYFNPSWSPNGSEVVCASTEGTTALSADLTNIFSIRIGWA